MFPFEISRKNGASAGGPQVRLPRLRAGSRRVPVLVQGAAHGVQRGYLLLREGEVEDLRIRNSCQVFEFFVKMLEDLRSFSVVSAPIFASK